MNYIYDTLLNWSDTNIYEFYEWRTSDDLEHIKKMPIIKVSYKDFKNLYNCGIIVDKSILDCIYQKTILFKNKAGNTLEYAAVFTNGLKAIAIEFDKQGKSIYKSDLLIEEETEVNELVRKKDCTVIRYKIIERNKKRILMTRFEEETKIYLINEFNKLYEDKNVSKLKYLYSEWYNKTSDDFVFMYNKIVAILDKEWCKKHIDLYNLIKLSYVNK
ncbi:MAG: DUF3603 family protein [Bacilli bacterium]|nr:DUF3603 family protein [Bacilli bacterium]